MATTDNLNRCVMDANAEERRRMKHLRTTHPKVKHRTLHGKFNNHGCKVFQFDKRRIPFSEVAVQIYAIRASPRDVY